MTFKAKVWLVLFAYVHLAALTWATETDHLAYFETLSHVTVVASRVKRSPDNLTSTFYQDVRFHAFQRSFHLNLTSGSPVIAQGFRARMVHKDGSSTIFPVDQSRLFSGHISDNVNATVIAHMEGTLWTIHVVEQGETFTVEPAHRLLVKSQNPHNDTMVAYRLSDVKGLPENLRFCGVRDTLNRSSFTAPRQSHKTTASTHTKPYYNVINEKDSIGGNGRGFKSRQKRYVKDTCLMYLVGDAFLFNGRCYKDPHVCSAFMISFLHLADSLYRASRFVDEVGRTYTGIGLQVAEIVLMTDYSTSEARWQGTVPHFNEKFEWDAAKKLTSFARYMTKLNSHYCLHHLFTEFRDHNGVLGRAYTDVLCGWRTGGQMAYNSATTSSINQAGFTMPTIMSKIVFAHEIGHNFGASHDPDTPECAPNPKDGGKYMMWQFAVSGLNSNNPHFSQCSLRQIGSRIPAWCFKARTKLSSFCGNGIIDAGEECDAGALGRAGENKCCDSECYLRFNSTCCEFNHECCFNCQIAPSGRPCRQPGHTRGCEKISYCTGTSTVCPEPDIMPDETPCDIEHVCWEGQCIGPCKQENLRAGNNALKPCRCYGNGTTACSWCCMNVTDPSQPGECKPILPQPRPDGSPCDGGVCLLGVCKHQIIPIGSNLRSYIGIAPVDSLGMFLRSNIVLTVILLSMFVWIPPAYIVYRIDCEERRKRELELDDLWNFIKADKSGKNFTSLREWVWQRISKKKRGQEPVNGSITFDDYDTHTFNLTEEGTTNNVNESPSQLSTISVREQDEVAESSISPLRFSLKLLRSNNTPTRKSVESTKGSYGSQV